MTEHGLKPGKDLGLVGFDDISLLNSIGYEITVLNRPIHEMGDTAFTMLTQRMNGLGPKGRSRKVLLDVQVISRGSEGGGQYLEIETA